MAKEYYVFDTVNKMQSCLNYINAFPVFPIVGKNAGTKEPAPHSQKTERWCDAGRQRVDGKWCIERIPAWWLDIMEVGPDKRQEFFAIHKPSIEEEQTGWWPEQPAEV